MAGQPTLPDKSTPPPEIAGSLMIRVYENPWGFPLKGRLCFTLFLGEGRCMARAGQVDWP